jgi:curved DNA-binding protein CbpA
VERPDPYIVLGVARQASAEEIARAYRRAARASHPDGGSAGSAERFRAVSDAYEELRDARRRETYDRSHPVVRSHPVDPPRGSVRYAAPGSQHVLLGRSAPRVEGLNGAYGGLLTFSIGPRIGLEVWTWRTF